MSDMKKVVIIGAGIAGLTAAHELSKVGGYDVTLLERNSEIGGLARSQIDENGCPTELSWRVYFGFYDNIFKILKDIPITSPSQLGSEDMEDIPTDDDRFQEDVARVEQLTNYGPLADKWGTYLSTFTPYDLIDRVPYKEGSFTKHIPGGYPPMSPGVILPSNKGLINYRPDALNYSWRESPVGLTNSADYTHANNRYNPKTGKYDMGWRGASNDSRQAQIEHLSMDNVTVADENVKRRVPYLGRMIEKKQETDPRSVGDDLLFTSLPFGLPPDELRAGQRGTMSAGPMTSRVMAPVYRYGDLRAEEPLGRHLRSSINRSVNKPLWSLNGDYLANPSVRHESLTEGRAGSSALSVWDCLVPYRHANFQVGEVGFFDTIKAYHEIARGLMSCDERLRANDKYTWEERMGSVSAGSIFRIIAPWLGIDRHKGSYEAVIRVGIEMDMLGSPEKRVMGGPTSTVWFDNWQRLLESRGVKFILNNRLDNIGDLPSADTYIFAVSVEELARLFPQRSDFRALVQDSLLTQVAVQLFFKSAPNLPGDTNAFAVAGSPWDLIVLSYDRTFIEPYRNFCGGKGAWSIVICVTDRPGYNGKNFKECSEEEIISEVWAELLASPDLASVKDADGYPALSPDNTHRWSKVWPAWPNDPKFSNNAGTLALRPSAFTLQQHADMFQGNASIYLATGYISETIDIFSMEGASIAGKLVACHIDKRVEAPTIRKRPCIFSAFRAFDGLLYRLGLCDAWLFILMVFLLIILLAFTGWFSTEPTNV